MKFQITQSDQTPVWYLELSDTGFEIPIHLREKWMKAERDFDQWQSEMSIYSGNLEKQYVTEKVLAVIDSNFVLGFGPNTKLTYLLQPEYIGLAPTHDWTIRFDGRDRNSCDDDLDFFHTNNGRKFLRYNGDRGTHYFEATDFKCDEPEYAEIEHGEFEKLSLTPTYTVKTGTHHGPMGTEILEYFSSQDGKTYSKKSSMGGCSCFEVVQKKQA